MTPVLQALLVADRVYEDKTTGKKIVAGVFHKVLFLKDQPAKVVEKEGQTVKVIAGGSQAGSPYAYVSLTDIRGKQSFVLRYVNLNEDEIVYETEFQIECKDPLDTVEAILALPSIPIVKAGTFALELLCDEEPLGSFRIRVEELQLPEPTDDSD